MMAIEEYRVKFYLNSRTGKEPVLAYIERLDIKNRTKILKYIEFLRGHQGYLDEPYSKHIVGKIRELKVDFSGNRHRIFYFTFLEKKIVLLHAFTKKTNKTPDSEIIKADTNYRDAISHPKLYE